MGIDKLTLPTKTVKALRQIDDTSAYILFLALHTYAAHGAPRDRADHICALLDALDFEIKVVNK